MGFSVIGFVFMGFSGDKLFVTDFVCDSSFFVRMTGFCYEFCV